jgi:hypothetical protein
MGLIAEVGIVAGGVFVVCSVVVVLLGAMTKRVKRPSQEKSFGSFKFDESTNEEALSGQAGLSAIGNLDDDLWGDDGAASEGVEPAMDTPEEELEVTSMVEQVVLQSDEATSPSDSVDPAPVAAPEPEPVEAAVQDEPEREAPPVPVEGLPNGWTMDQWKWYGHQWLEQNK